MVGDLLDATVAPGPFDVIIERRTVQTFQSDHRPAALSALAARLRETGNFLSHCNDANFFSPHPNGVAHASEFWFQERGWALWKGAPSSEMVGRVALLAISAS